MATIPAYSINGFTRPELHTDSAGNIILDPVAAKVKPRPFSFSRTLA